MVGSGVLVKPREKKHQGKQSLSRQQGIHLRDGVQEKNRTRNQTKESRDIDKAGGKKMAVKVHFG